MEYNFDMSSNDIILNTITDIDFPVYRSIAIDNSNNNNNSHFNSYNSYNTYNIDNNDSNMFISQPLFPQKSTINSNKTTFQNDFEIEIDNNFNADDDLMSFLNECSNDINENEIQSLDSLNFDCLAKTSVRFNHNQMTSEEVISKINEYLKENNIAAEKKGLSKWVCESFVQVEFIKFQIQIFSTIEGFVVEFLRLRGCCLTFSSLFRKFNAETTAASVSKSNNIENNISELEVSDISSETIISLLQSDIVEGIKIICSFLPTSNIQDKLIKITNILVESKELNSIITFVRYLLNDLSLSKSSSSSDNLLQCYDILIPLLVKESFNPLISSYIRSQCKELVEKRVNLY